MCHKAKRGCKSRGKWRGYSGTFNRSLTIPVVDEDLLRYSSMASEPLESKSQAPVSEVAASSCLKRTAALAGLGVELWG